MAYAHNLPCNGKGNEIARSLEGEFDNEAPQVPIYARDHRYNLDGLRSRELADEDLVGIVNEALLQRRGQVGSQTYFVDQAIKIFMSAYADAEAARDPFDCPCAWGFEEYCAFHGAVRDARTQEDSSYSIGSRVIRYRDDFDGPAYLLTLV